MELFGIFTQYVAHLLLRFLRFVGQVARWTCAYLPRNYDEVIRWNKNECVVGNPHNRRCANERSVTAFDGIHRRTTHHPS
ncbi:hypothetical protein DFV48_18825 [Salmonella enterica subsp. enterica serovar Agama]|nr:hypothetical protein [Salmonella enterica subsp. enterica serovar Agama]EAA6031564.1 hypothetical protein [Salmonella enterica subsp. enterica serovar Kingston]EAB7580362.1 hypothetical protein [Salmonella enterica subsp. enterica]EAB8247078.1 hypothetical protein [Salmonella enterica subsp. enterica serovar Typhimurium]EAM1006562.1 hypothetical protein [Salmonella enterica]EBQ9605983.1 hypothetical protein [Salmonella enterica subsp. enterica serovar Virchow]EBU7766410.1 hypothetical prot